MFKTNKCFTLSDVDKMLDITVKNFHHEIFISNCDLIFENASQLRYFSDSQTASYRYTSCVMAPAHNVQLRCAVAAVLTMPTVSSAELSPGEPATLSVLPRPESTELALATETAETLSLLTAKLVNCKLTVLNKCSLNQQKHNRNTTYSLLTAKLMI